MIWAIGDIHGMFDPLKRLLERIREFDKPEDPAKVIFLGDYIDHGPSSKETLDLVMRLDLEKVCLAGNHEDMALR
ncbi:MAG: metallophosphoesterase, partial [Deltaproteobacteria bacterium]|nr:metallophosphoesterase [Deltaproteobacteria bacterium]